MSHKRKWNEPATVDDGTTPPAYRSPKARDTQCDRCEEFFSLLHYWHFGDRPRSSSKRCCGCRLRRSALAEIHKLPKPVGDAKKLQAVDAAMAELEKLRPVHSETYGRTLSVNEIHTTLSMILNPAIRQVVLEGVFPDKKEPKATTSAKRPSKRSKAPWQPSQKVQKTSRRRHKRSAPANATSAAVKHGGSLAEPADNQLLEDNTSELPRETSQTSLTSYEADMRKTTHVGTSVSVTRTPPRYPSTPRAISETSQLFDFDGKARGSPTYTDIDLSFEDLDSASADAKASGAAAKVHSGSTHLEVLIEHNVLSNSHQAFKTSPSTNIIVGALEGWTEDWGSMSLSDLDFSPPTHESEEDLYGDFLTHGPSFPWMSRTPVLPPPTASGTKIDAEGNDECQDMLGPSPPPSPITSAIKAKAKLSKECDKEIDKLTDEVATHCENIQKYNDRAARSLATIQEARQKAVPDVVGMRKSAADAVLSSNAMLRHQEKMAAKAKALQKLLKQG